MVKISSRRLLLQDLVFKGVEYAGLNRFSSLGLQNVCGVSKAHCEFQRSNYSFSVLPNYSPGSTELPFVSVCVCICMWGHLSSPTQHRARGPGVHDGHMGTSAELDEQRGPRAATRQRSSFHKGGRSWGPLTPGRQAGRRDVLSRPSVAMSFLPAPGLPGAPCASRPLQPTQVAAEATGSAPSLQVLPPDNPESDLPAARKPSKDPGPASTSTKAHPGLGGLVSTQMRSGVRARRQDGTRDG